MVKKVTNTSVRNTRTGASQHPQQAQKERQEQVTETQSLTLVKNLIRVSISTVCSLRGIFPQGCFQERTYAGMKIYQLDAATRDADTNETVVKDQEAYDLTKWLESGVFEAIELRYLRRMEFIITSPEHENPREAYSFDLTYPDDPRDETVTFGGTKVTTVASTKGQLVKLIRSLIAFGNTLGELPRERFLNIKLWYFEDRTPAGWQPKHFREADPAELKFSKGRDDEEIDSKLKIKIGDLTTPHHTLSLRFTGYDPQEQGQQEKAKSDEAREERVSGGGGDDDDDGSVTEAQEHDSHSSASDSDREEAGSHRGRWSRQQGGSLGLLKCKFGPGNDQDDDSLRDDVNDGDEDNDDDEETEVPAVIAERDASKMVSGMMTQLDVASKGHTHDSDDSYEGGHPVEIDHAYDAAKAWALGLSRPTIGGLMEHLDLPKELARQCLDRMADEGHLVKRNFRFHRAADPPQASPSSRVLPSSGGDTRRKDRGHQASSSGSDDMDVDDTVAGRGKSDVLEVEGGGRGGRGGDIGDGSFSSQTSSATEDDSETQAPVLEHSSVENRTLSSRNQQQDRDRTPSSMPPPRGAAPGRRHTPEGSATTVNRNDGRDFATPPIPKSSTQPNLQPVPEKPQRDPILSMATKRVLDGPALSGRDDGNSDDHDHRNDQTDYTQDNTAARLRDEEPIDVFNPEKDGLGSETGYERLALSQASAVSAVTGRTKRKCSLAINPIHQILPSKRLRVENGVQKKKPQGRE